MIQLDKDESSQDVYFATSHDFDRGTCLFKFTNLMTNQSFQSTIVAGREGDWHKATLSLDLSTQPVGMYAVRITLVSGSVFLARRLVYLAPNSESPVTTDYDTYNASTTNVVYEG